MYFPYVYGFPYGPVNLWSRPHPTHLIHVVVALTKLASVLYDDLEMGEPLPDLQNLVQLLLVLHNTHIGLTVVKDEPTSLGGVCWVDANTESPGVGWGV